MTSIDERRLDDLAPSTPTEIIGGTKVPPPDSETPEYGIRRERDRHGANAGPASAEARRDGGAIRYEAGTDESSVSGRVEP